MAKRSNAWSARFQNPRFCESWKPRFADRDVGSARLSFNPAAIRVLFRLSDFGTSRRFMSTTQNKRLPDTSVRFQNRRHPARAIVIGGLATLFTAFVCFAQEPPKESGNFRKPDLVELIKLDPTI